MTGVPDKPSPASRPFDECDALTLRASAEAALAAGDVKTAAEAGLAAYRLTPGDVELGAAVGGVLLLAGRAAEAVEVLDAVLARQPMHGRAAENLLAALVALKRDGRAEAEARRFLPLAGRFPGLYSNIASAFQKAGFATEACEALLAQLNLGQGGLPAMCAYASYLNYAPGISAENVADVHRWVGEAFAAQAAHLVSTGQARLPAWAGGPFDPERRLKVGVVSPDLRTHSVAFFLEPLLEHLDRAAFEVTAYSTADAEATKGPGGVEDPTTTRLRTLCARWRDCAGMTEPALAAVIAQDGIDVLLDLGGLFQGQAQGVFALAAAPVAATYLGYPHSTGNRAIGWRLVDSLTDPPGSERLSTERLARLDPCFLCYKPPADAPDVAARRVNSTGGVVFGCMGSLAKYTERQCYLWARVLLRVPGSRLLLKAPAFADEVLRERTRRRIAVYLPGGAVDGEPRVELRPPEREIRDHLASYNGVDVALDTFPYHGTTTTVEAAFMGVPTVTLVGDRHASRVGLSILSALGLPDLAAKDEGAFIELAAGLAGDAARRAELRAGLRARLRASPLGDAPGFARRFEVAVRGMWRERCARGKSERC
jgi:predicted O-linked N-acetylglucosamine transferase (SPINDLY family)